MVMSAWVVLSTMKPVTHGLVAALDVGNLEFLTAPHFDLHVFLTVIYCHPRRMTVTAEQIASIPTRNVRVPCGDLAVVWNDAEDRLTERGRQEVLDWYAAAIVATCMWLACAVYKPPWGRPHPAEAPASRTRASAYEELIEAECLAAERFEVLYPHRAERMPGWGDGVRATLRGAWRGQGPPPVEVDGQPAVG